MDSALFVGGVADGQIRAIERHRDCYVFTKMEGTFSPHLEEFVQPTTTVYREVYTLRGIKAGGIQVYAKEDMAMYDVVNSLLTGYRQPKLIEEWYVL